MLCPKGVNNSLCLTVDNTMGSGKRVKNKKRVRSEGSAEKMESEQKKPKSVKNLLGEQSSPEMSTGTLSPLSPKGATLPAETEVMSTPKVTLDFENKVNSPISNDPSAPKWAQDLIACINDLKSEIARVSAIAENTQKAIAGVINNNMELSTSLNKVTDHVRILERDSQSLRAENVELREKLLLLEFHQRRNNLVFTGIPECDGPESGRDCYDRIMECVSQIPNLNVAHIQVDRCHRLGVKQRNRHRGIIARFNWYGDLVDILNGRSYLPTGIYVSEDYPDEWNDRRQLLRPILNHARRIPKYQHSCRLVRDKLVVDGKQFTVAPFNNLSELPPDIIPAHSCEKRDENTIAFLGPHSVYSNFHLANFIEGGVKYSSAEQMIQAEKAALFNDKVSLVRIMKTTNPYRVKEIGSRIKGFNKEIWSEKCKDIALRAVKSKFEQNPSLRQILHCSGTLLLVESSPDKIWGTGLHLHDKNSLSRSNWAGNGLMSEILLRVRSLLDP